MTALHPLEDKTRARGVLALQYPINEVCAHPECSEPTESRHHIFARSKIGNSSWFVALEGSKLFEADGHIKGTKDALPHVVGMCGHGTAGHHGDAEEHRAWIRLENGIFVWYDRVEVEGEVTWKEVGPLDPQPGSRIKHRRPKKRDHRSDGKPRAATAYTFKVPVAVQKGEITDDVTPDDLDQALEAIEARLGYDPPRSKWFTLWDAINFAQLNMDGTDVR